MRGSDLPFAMRLVEIVGWNQIPPDWARLLRICPDGCFLAEWNGMPAATATAVHYGLECAWVGLVLVEPEFRRRGIGMGLLSHCIGHLNAMGVRTVKLDATDEGRAVYLKQGFVEEYQTRRHVGRLRPAAAPPAGCTFEPWSESHRPAIAAMDRAAFGADRGALLAALVEQHPDLALVARQGGALIGYGLARPGRLYGYVGPVVAEQQDVAEALAAELAGRLEQPTVLIDSTSHNGAWCRWLEDGGLRVQRRLTRMYLGTNDSPGDPRRVYALSGFETG